jgi:hypothetical protein
MNIKYNNTLYRKDSFVPSNIISNSQTNIDISNNITLFNEQNNFGQYLRPSDYLKYIDNNMFISKTIQIDSSDRDVKYFLSPYNFTTYIGDNNGILRTIIDTNTNKTKFSSVSNYIEPRMNNLPNIYDIVLQRIMIPNNYIIIKENVNLTDFTTISNYLIDNINSIIINKSYFVSNCIITIVNFINNKKINIIINYNPAIVYSFILNNNNITNIYKYCVDYSLPSKNEREMHLIIKELNDNYNYNTNSNYITTFILYPKSIKNKYLFANDKNIVKRYLNNPLKLNKLTIVLTDGDNNELKIYNLDSDINSNKECICTFETKNYSCSCNYILHPYNPKYQIYMQFSFSFLRMTFNEPNL